MSTPKTAGALLATTGTDPQVPGVAQMAEHLSKALAAVAAEAEVTVRYLTQDPVPTAAVRKTVRALADEVWHVAEMYRALRLRIERRLRRHGARLTLQRDPAEKPTDALSRTWWLLLLRGTVAWAAVQCSKQREAWWVLLLVGLLGLGVGLVTLILPGVTAVALLFYMAIWAMSTGVIHVATAIRLRREIEGEWRLALAGCASISFGLLMMVRSGAGALAALWTIATYAVVLGILLVMLAFEVNGLRNRLLEQLT